MRNCPSPARQSHRLRQLWAPETAAGPQSLRDQTKQKAAKVHNGVSVWLFALAALLQEAGRPALGRAAPSRRSCFERCLVGFKAAIEGIELCVWPYSRLQQPCRPPSPISCAFCTLPAITCACLSASAFDALRLPQHRWSAFCCDTLAPERMRFRTHGWTPIHRSPRAWRRTSTMQRQFFWHQSRRHHERSPCDFSRSPTPLPAAYADRNSSRSSELQPGRSAFGLLRRRRRHAVEPRASEICHLTKESHLYGLVFLLGVEAL